MIRLHIWGRSCGKRNKKTESLTSPHKDTQTNHRCHIRNHSWRAAACMGGNGLVAWCLTCQKGRTPDTNMYIKLGGFLFSSVGRMLQSFPPLTGTDFVKCVMELWIMLYNTNSMWYEICVCADESVCIQKINYNVFLWPWLQKVVFWDFMPCVQVYSRNNNAGPQAMLNFKI